MNWKKIELKDDGEVVSLTLSKKDFILVEVKLKKAGIIPQLASKKENVFLFPRDQYDKIVSWSGKTRGIRIIKKKPFFYVEIEEVGRYLDIRANVDLREMLYVCSSCGFKTHDVSELHEEHRGGGVSHACGCCRNYTGSGSLESWETRAQDLKNLETNFKVVYFTNLYGKDSDCEICKGEIR